MRIVFTFQCGCGDGCDGKRDVRNVRAFAACLVRRTASDQCVIGGDLEPEAYCSARQARKQLRREAILAVAAESFLTNGYAGTSMSSIASNLGGSKSTLWKYFSCKAALFEAALDQAIEAYHARLSELLDPDENLQLTLRRFATNFVGILALPNSIALHRLVQGEAGRFPEVGQIFYRRVPRRTQELLADYFLGAMQRRLMREDDALVAARTFIALCMSGGYQQLMLGLREEISPEVIERDVAQTLYVFMHAYAPDVA